MTHAVPVEHSPVAIEQAIREVANRIARGVTICDERYRAFLEADQAYDVAYARAYLGAEGPAYQKGHIAELATVAERSARDIADAAYRYADRRAKALQDELRAWQSVGASVRQAFAIAGRGEGVS